MARVFQVGGSVQASVAIQEERFHGYPIFFHARAGDTGTVLDVVDAEWVNVFFEREQTITICHVSEIRTQRDA